MPCSKPGLLVDWLRELAPARTREMRTLGLQKDLDISKDLQC